jgi:hypothetical protein
LLLLIATGEAREPATIALVSTLQESMGKEVTVRVQETADLSDAEALRVERELRADATAVVRWRGPEHLGATVRMHNAERNVWYTRTITFTPQDASSEKGRSIALLMVAVGRDGEPPDTSAAPPEPPAPSPPAAGAPSKRAVETPAPAVTKAATVAPDENGGASRGLGLGASGIGTVGAGGPATGLGAGLEGIGRLTNRLAIRLGASWRTGRLSELPGSDTVVSAGAGCEAWLVGAGRTVSLGVRIGALAILHRVRADADGGLAEARNRWLPGAEIRIQSSVRLGSNLVWMLGAGADAAAGSTEIRKGDDRVVVATIPPVTLIGETGLRLMF